MESRKDNRRYSVTKILREDQIQCILKKAVGYIPYQLISSEMYPAADKGLLGFLGEHMKAVLSVKVEGDLKQIKLFVKRIPTANAPKATYIDENDYFRREEIMFQIMEEMDQVDEGPNPWGVRAYVYTDSLVVMPDLAAAGYRVHPFKDEFDLQHTLLVTASTARYHAAYGNYETKKTLNGKRYSFYDTYKHVLTEPKYTDTPFVRSGAKLCADYLDAFSDKYHSKSIPNLEDKIAKLFLDACNSFEVMDDTWNVPVHKDLWNNNILFKYEGDKPINAVIIDYQCMRFGPPCFDLTTFLYLTTSRAFRDEHYEQVLKYYYKVFAESLTDATKKRLDALGYGKDEFFSWCERARMFGIFLAVVMDPLVLLDPQAAQEVYDDPHTFETIINHDRSAPIINYAKREPVFRRRLLEVSEEFVERYLNC